MYKRQVPKEASGNRCKEDSANPIAIIRIHDKNEPHPVKRTEKKYKDFSQGGRSAALWQPEFPVFVRACLKIVNTPNQRVFCRHTSPIFLERHPVFLRKIGLVWQQNPPHLVIFPFFKQGLIKNFNYSISARDTGNDLVRQRANSIAQSPDNKVSLASQRLYRSIGIAILPDMVARHTGTNPFFTPAVLWIVDPPKSSLILKH